MAESQSLEDRLRGHANAFNSLLSLIPAKDYYGEDRSDQWKRKKQTKEQARAAKMAKLDPSNYKSALDVIQENDKKRKRESSNPASKDTGAEEDTADGGTLKRQARPSPPADAKAHSKENGALASEARITKNKSRKDGKGPQKEDKQVRKPSKKNRKREAAESKKTQRDSGGEESDLGEDINISLDIVDIDDGKARGDVSTHQSQTERSIGDLDSGGKSPSSTSSSIPSATEFDFSTQPSGTSSISSVGTSGSSKPNQTASTESTSASQSIPSMLRKVGPEGHRSMAEMQEKLRRIIAEKRAARNADVEGRPVQSRSELIESRRKRQAQRKATKKALRQQAKEEEAKNREESLARGSPLMSPAMNSPSLSDDSPSFAFGRIAFENGISMSADLGAALDLSKRKGPSDAKTALQKAGAIDAKLAGMDPSKRAEAEEKNMWLSARKRAHGERSKDDTSLLKKALKRKQKQKDKSANDWKKRLDGIKASREAKQRKREENLAKRKDDRGGKKGGKSSKTKSPKKRPGFEGSFRTGNRK